MLKTNRKYIIAVINKNNNEELYISSDKNFQLSKKLNNAIVFRTKSECIKVINALKNKYKNKNVKYKIDIYIYCFFIKGKENMIMFLNGEKDKTTSIIKKEKIL